MSLFLQREGFGQTYPLDRDKDLFLIGRSPQCDLHFSSPHISRQHCEINRLKTNGKLIIKNLKDTNVTYVDGTELRNATSYMELQIGHVIGLGVPLCEERTNTKFVFLRLCQETPVAEQTEVGTHDITRSLASNQSLTNQHRKTRRRASDDNSPVLPNQKNIVKNEPPEVILLEDEDNEDSKNDHTTSVNLLSRQNALIPLPLQTSSVSDAPCRSTTLDAPSSPALGVPSRSLALDAPSNLNDPQRDISSSDKNISKILVANSDEVQPEKRVLSEADTLNNPVGASMRIRITRISDQSYEIQPSRSSIDEQQESSTSITSKPMVQERIPNQASRIEEACSPSLILNVASKPSSSQQIAHQNESGSVDQRSPRIIDQAVSSTPISDKVTVTRKQNLPNRAVLNTPVTDNATVKGHPSFTNQVVLSTPITDKATVEGKPSFTNEVISSTPILDKATVEGKSSFTNQVISSTPITDKLIILGRKNSELSKSHIGLPTESPIVNEDDDSNDRPSAFRRRACESFGFTPFSDSIQNDSPHSLINEDSSQKISRITASSSKHDKVSSQHIHNKNDQPNSNVSNDVVKSCEKSSVQSNIPSSKTTLRDETVTKTWEAEKDDIVLNPNQNYLSNDVGDDDDVDSIFSFDLTQSDPKEDKIDQDDVFDGNIREPTDRSNRKKPQEVSREVSVEAKRKRGESDEEVSETSKKKVKMGKGKKLLQVNISVDDDSSSDDSIFSNSKKGTKKVNNNNNKSTHESHNILASDSESNDDSHMVMVKRTKKTKHIVESEEDSGPDADANPPLRLSAVVENLQKECKVTLDRVPKNIIKGVKTGRKVIINALDDLELGSPSPREEKTNELALFSPIPSSSKTKSSKLEECPAVVESKKEPTKVKTNSPIVLASDKNTIDNKTSYDFFDDFDFYFSDDELPDLCAALPKKIPPSVASTSSSISHKINTASSNQEKENLPHLEKVNKSQKPSTKMQSKSNEILAKDQKGNSDIGRTTRKDISSKAKNISEFADKKKGHVENKAHHINSKREKPYSSRRESAEEREKSNSRRESAQEREKSSSRRESAEEREKSSSRRESAEEREKSSRSRREIVEEREKPSSSRREGAEEKEIPSSNRESVEKRVKHISSKSGSIEERLKSSSSKRESVEEREKPNSSNRETEGNRGKTSNSISGRIEERKKSANAEREDEYDSSSRCGSETSGKESTKTHGTTTKGEQDHAKIPRLSSNTTGEDSQSKASMKRKNDDDLGHVKVKKEKVDGDELKTDGKTGKVSCSLAVAKTTVGIDTIMIKKEPVDDDKKDQDGSDEEDDDDDDIICMYSQADDTVWISSDEDETPSQENATFGPLPPSPDLGLAELFDENESETGVDITCDAKPEEGEEEEEDFQWFPILSQGFFDDDLPDPTEKEKKQDENKDQDTIDTGAGPSGINNISNFPSSSTSAWCPELSQNFDDDDDDMDIFAGPSEPKEKNLDSVIEKLKNKTTRKAQLIDPMTPLPRTKNDTLRKRSRTTSNEDKKLHEPKIRNRSTSHEEILEEKNKKEVVSPRLRKSSRKGPSLRENLSNKFKLDSYKAIAKHHGKDSSPLERDRSHRSDRVRHDKSSKSLSHESSKASNHESSRSSRRVKEKSEPTRKSHLITDEPRKGENISIQKKSSQREATNHSKSTVAAKVTRKTRSEKLTEVNLFPSPTITVSKPKKPAFTIPKVKGGEPKENSSKKMEVLFGDDSGNGIAEKSSTRLKGDRPSRQPLSSTTSSPVPQSGSSLESESSKQLSNNGSKVSDKSTKHAKISKNTSLDGEPATDELHPDEENKENQIGEDVASKGILKAPGSKKSKKKVHFPPHEEIVKIKYIEPRTDSEKLGNLSVKAREVKPQGLVLNNHNIPCNYLEHFIFKICKWNYDWLETYRNAQELAEKSGKGKMVPPPIGVVKDTNFPALILYDNYNDYKETFSALLYLEVWENVYKDWLKYRLSISWYPTYVDVIHPTPVQVMYGPPLPSWRIKLIILISQDQSRKGLYPRQGSLIAVKVSDGNKRQYFFAYVEDFAKQKKRMIVKELANACPQGDVVILLNVRFSKNPTIDIKPGMMVSICNTSYVRPFTRNWEGLCQLPLSPLCNDILSPGENCFLVHHSPEYLVHGMPLNECQSKAVTEISGKCVLDPHIPKLSLIHGPPGTGKTRTIVSLIGQIASLSREERVGVCRILLCAPSNAAADELTLRLMKLREIIVSLRVVRVGIRENIAKQVRPCTLESFVEKNLKEELKSPKNNASKKEWERMKALVAQSLESLNKAKQDKKPKEVIKGMELRRDELMLSLSKFEKSFSTNLSPHQYNELQQKWQRRILESAEVIVTTLGGCYSGIMSDIFSQKAHPFSCCIIDEAGQCKETETWLPLLFGIRKLVLVGDHRQLPATVISQLAQDKNMKQSLFERLYHRFAIELQKEEMIHTLDVQYRMHPEIVQWPSEHFYFSKLKTCPDVIPHKIHDFKPYAVFDMKNSLEQRGPFNELFNMTEVIAVKLILEALEPQISGLKIGVITPYQKQKYLLERDLSLFSQRLNIVVNTIDGFQGQERDIIILSFVRANASSQIGFLSERQRLNVALTRARKSCFIIASLSSLSKNKDWQSLIDNAKGRKLVYPTTDKDLNKVYFNSILRR